MDLILEALIQKKGLRRIEVAREANVLPSSLTSWLSGKDKPSTKSLKKLAKYFNVSADYLLGRTTSIAQKEERRRCENDKIRDKNKSRSEKKRRAR